MKAIKDEDLYKVPQEVTRIYCKLLEEKHTDPYTFIVATGGDYLVELIGGGGGGVHKSSDDTTGSGSGASGGYFKGIIRLNTNDKVSFTFGAGGAGRSVTTYSEISAPSGTASTLSINDVLTITTNGGEGGRSRYVSVYGATVLDDPTRIVSVISDTGINGSFVRGGQYAHPTISRTMSPFSKTDDGYGSGGGYNLSEGGASSGGNGAMRIAITYAVEPEEYDYYIDKIRCFGIRY